MAAQVETRACGGDVVECGAGGARQRGGAEAEAARVVLWRLDFSSWVRPHSSLCVSFGLVSGLALGGRPSPSARR
jgi:hypothetical protein